MRTKLIMATLVIAAVGAAGVVVALGMGGGGVSEVVVPIEAEGADDVGALHIELGYDPQVLSPVQVEAGDLAGNAMMEYNIDTQGWVVISLVDSSGMGGEGSLAEVKFDVIAEGDAATSLTLENIGAWDATNVFDIPTSATPGSFTTGEGLTAAPVLAFGT